MSQAWQHAIISVFPMLYFSHMKMRVVSVLTSLALLLSPAAARAAAFNPHFIISDAEMRRSDALSLGEIQLFLDQKGGLGRQFDIDPEDGLLKGTAQLVDDAAKRHRINPKYVLALIQKESGAVEAKKPTARQLDWASGYGLCDKCLRSNALAQKNKGLGKQIEAGAGWMDWYMTNAASLAKYKQPGGTYAISKMKVTPANLATAGLYNYTPHVHGNRLLWSIMNRWFSGAGLGLRFPDGTLLRNEKNGAVGLMRGGRFRPIASRAVLETRFRSNVIVDINEYDFAAVSAEPGPPVKFVDPAIVRTEEGATYLLQGNERRLIPSADVFAKIGFNPEEVEEAKMVEITEYREGVPIAADETYPTGALMQDAKTGGVYFMRSGIKHPIWDKALLAANFLNEPISRQTPEALAAHPTGDPVRFPDGTLIKSPDQPGVFVISEGRRRSIPTEEVFYAYGYSFDKVLTTSSRALGLHEMGDALLLAPENERQASVSAGVN